MRTDATRLSDRTAALLAENPLVPASERLLARVAPANRTLGSGVEGDAIRGSLRLRISRCCCFERFALTH
jgi:hypothetical protein